MPVCQMKVDRQIVAMLRQKLHTSYMGLLTYKFTKFVNDVAGRYSLIYMNVGGNISTLHGRAL